MSNVGISLIDSRAAFETGAAAQRLNLLDDLWTSYAQAIDPGDDEAFEGNRVALEELVTDMQRLLSDIQPSAEWLLALATGIGEEAIERAVDELMASAPISQELQAALGLHSDSPLFANALFAACELVLEQAPAESEELQAKLESLIRTKVQAGDFRLNFKCGLTIVGAGGLVVGGAILGALTGVAVGALALGTLGGGATGAGGALIAVAASPCLPPEPRTAT